MSLLLLFAMLTHSTGDLRVTTVPPVERIVVHVLGRREATDGDGVVWIHDLPEGRYGLLFDSGGRGWLPDERYMTPDWYPFVTIHAGKATRIAVRLRRESDHEMENKD